MNEKTSLFLFANLAEELESLHLVSAIDTHTLLIAETQSLGDLLNKQILQDKTDLDSRNLLARWKFYFPKSGLLHEEKFCSFDEFNKILLDAYLFSSNYYFSSHTGKIMGYVSWRDNISVFLVANEYLSSTDVGQWDANFAGYLSTIDGEGDLFPEKLLRSWNSPRAKQITVIRGSNKEDLR